MQHTVTRPLKLALDRISLAPLWVQRPSQSTIRLTLSGESAEQPRRGRDSQRFLLLMTRPFISSLARGGREGWKESHCPE